ncbi:MAG: BrnT family toxin [Candidatus Aadella gelida]|nr:BrnT family toxin [Candidatus Aadella gelida]
MEFEWNKDKNKNNIKKHGLDFSDAFSFFENPYLSYEDKRNDYKEKRVLAIGTIEKRVVAVVFTKRERKTRIISMRKANEREKKKFKNKL